MLRKIDGIDIRDRSEEEEALRAKLQKQHQLLKQAKIEEEYDEELAKAIQASLNFST